MTCRHSYFDPTCSSYREQYLEAKRVILSEITPDSKNYTILGGEIIGEFLLLKIQYPNCSKCSFEGVKIVVYNKGLTFLDALKWKEIDPHFRDPDAVVSERSAPTPFARFPGTDSGWESAKMMARLLSKE